jgi:hypothetical protein
MTTKISTFGLGGSGGSSPTPSGDFVPLFKGVSEDPRYSEDGIVTPDHAVASLATEGPFPGDILDKTGPGVNDWVLRAKLLESSTFDEGDRVTFAEDHTQVEIRISEENTNTVEMVIKIDPLHTGVADLLPVVNGNTEEASFVVNHQREIYSAPAAAVASSQESKQLLDSPPTDSYVDFQIGGSILPPGRELLDTDTLYIRMRSRRFSVPNAYPFTVIEMLTVHGTDNGVARDIRVTRSNIQVKETVVDTLGVACPGVQMLGISYYSVRRESSDAI